MKVSNRRFSLICGAAAIGCLGLARIAAAADSPTDQAGNQALLDKINSLQAKVERLEAAKQETPETHLNARDVDAVANSVMTDAKYRSQLLMESGGFTGGWMDDRGFVIQSADGNYSLHPGVQFQFRSDTVWNDKQKSNGDANTDNGFEVRNLRLSFDGTIITKNLRYNFVWNTARDSGSLVNEEAYIQYRFADDFSIKVGQYKEYIYHEQTVHDKRQLAVDRSLLNVVLNSTGVDSTGVSYVQGVDLLWDNGGPLHADVGFIDGYGSRNTTFQDPPVNAFDFGAHGRIEWLVFGKNFDGYNQFTSMGNKSGDFLVLGAGGDWSQSGSLNIYHHNVDAQWNGGPWGVYAAFVGLYTDPGSAGTSSWDYGFLVQGSYLINPQWEIFARYDYTKLDGGKSAIAHGSEDTFHEITAGVNYYLHGQNAKVTLDVGWLPNGAPNSQTAIGVLANDGDNEFYIRGQFSLVL
jgi:hypothetical protein